MNMEIQYSLLAALVDEEKANLFDDIVLHIIEYVVSLIAEESSFSAKYHSTSSLQDMINSRTLDNALDSMEKAYSQFNKLEHKGFLLINGVILDNLTPPEAMKEVREQLNITH